MPCLVMLRNHIEWVARAVPHFSTMFRQNLNFLNNPAIHTDGINKSVFFAEYKEVHASVEG